MKANLKLKHSIRTDKELTTNDRQGHISEANAEDYKRILAPSAVIPQETNNE